MGFNIIPRKLAPKPRPLGYAGAQPQPPSLSLLPTGFFSNKRGTSPTSAGFANQLSGIAQNYNTALNTLNQNPNAYGRDYVRQLQIRLGVTPDGIYGPQTAAALARMNNSQIFGATAQYQSAQAQYQKEQDRLNRMKLMHAAQVQKLQSLAAETRKKLLKQAKDYAKLGPKYRKAASQLLDYATNPKYDNADVVHFAYGTRENGGYYLTSDNKTVHDTRGYFGRQAQAEAQAANAEVQKNSGAGGFAKGVLGTAAGLAGKAFNWLDNAYEASKLAQHTGGNPFEQAQAFVAGIPGLGFVAPGGTTARNAVEATNTAAERAALTKKGLIPGSFGTFITGHTNAAYQKRYGAAPYRAPNVPVGKLAYAALGGPAASTVLAGLGFSGAGKHLPGYKATVGSDTLVNAAVQLASDPTLIVGKSLHASALVAENVFKAGAEGALRAGLDDAAAREIGGRAVTRWATETKVGRTVVENAAKAAEKALDGPALLRAVPGIPRDLADQLVAVAHDSPQNLRSTIVDTLASGEWNPKVSLANRLGIKAGLGPLDSGGLAIARPSSGVLGGRGAQAVRNWMAERAAGVRAPLAGTAASETGSGADAIARGVRQVVREGGVRADALDAAAGAARVGGEDTLGRLNAVFDVAAENPAFGDAVEQTFKPFFKQANVRAALGLEKGAELSAQDFNRALNLLDQHTGFNVILQDAERMAAALRGDLGDKAKQVAQRYLDTGFAPAQVKGGLGFATKAADNVGVKLPTKPLEGGKIDPEHLLTVDIEGLPDGALKDELKGDLEKTLAKKGAKQKAGLAKLQATVEGLYKNEGGVLDEAVRLADQQDARLFSKGAAAAETPGSIGNPITRGLSRFGTSFVETRPRPFVNITGSNEVTARHEVASLFDSNMADLKSWGFTPNIRAQFRDRLMEAETLDDYLRVYGDVVERAAKNAGVDPEAVNVIRRNITDRIGKQTQAFSVDELGNAITDRPQLITQGQRALRLPPPKDIADAIREELAKSGDAWSQVRVTLTKTGGIQLRQLAFLGSKDGAVTLTQTLKATHNLWKFLIVTNAYMPVIGAVGGYLGGGGSLLNPERFKRAGIGFAAGLLGPVRYLGRTQLQDRLAAYWENGLFNKTFSRAYARSQLEAGIIDRPFGAVNYLNPEYTAGPQRGFLTDLFLEADPNWQTLNRSQSRYLDSWWRMVNFQAHPESDPVMELLLQERAGLLSTQEADQAIGEFLKGPDADLWKRQFREQGTKSPLQAVEQERAWVEKFIPPDIAEGRLKVMNQTGGEVTRQELKAVPKDVQPELVYGQKNNFPRSPKQLLESVQRVQSKLSLELPHVHGTAKPLANAIYEEEYYRLLRRGVNPERAASLAEDQAVTEANRVMFRHDRFSRFGTKSDFFIPFQGHREFTIKTWSRLALENPGRTIRMAYRGAQAFNAGRRAGYFRKDAFGDWVLSVPGSAKLSRALFGLPFDFQANLTGFFIVTEGGFDSPWQGLTPTLSGPYMQVASKWFATHHPEVINSMPGGLEKVLFPYGIKGNLLRNEPNRLWMAMTGSVPPWEYLDRNDQEAELRKWQIEMYNNLVWLHRLGDPTDTSWTPDVKDVQKATQNFFLAWSLIGSVFPASTHPISPEAKDFQDTADVWKKVTGKTPFQDRSNFLAQYPAFEPYMNNKTEYTGPDDAKHWSEHHNSSLEVQLGQRRELSLREFDQQFKQAQANAQGWREYHDALNAPTPQAKEQALYEWRQKHPDLNKYLKDSTQTQVELTHILATYPKGRLQDAAIERWRKMHQVSFAKYQQLRGQVTHGMFFATASRLARDPEVVAADVRKNAGADPDSQAARMYIASLNPAEQRNYWYWQADQVTYTPGTDDPSKVYDLYSKYIGYASDVNKLYPWLRAPAKPKNATAVWQDAVLENVKQQVSAANSEIYDVIKPQMDAAAQSKNWTLYYSLKAKRQALYDHITALQNSIYNTIPDMGPYWDDVKAMTAYAGLGNAKGAAEAQQRMMADLNNLYFLPSNEESWYLSLPDPIKQAYTEKLAGQLSTPSGQSGKKFWAYLTNFQKDLLSQNMPQWQVADWQAEDPNADTKSGSFKYHHKGTYNSLYRRYGKVGAGELSYAYALLSQYNRRGGLKAPPAYQDYLKLPSNPAVKNDFLRKHPEVANYIKLGPMANMPPLDSLLVQNILIKYGKWQGDLMTTSEITDLAFAREQLQRWSRRPQGAQAPETYDLWVNMPSGEAKAQYLQQHPEIQQWLALGPMANMPDDYKSIVRDIMERYGEWTTGVDPLSQTLSQYYAAPGWAREQFLQDHPELLAYWRASRSPEQNAVQDLVDQYFSIQDPNARRTLLSSEPQLQQYFLDQRNKRYERFLNQVAQYMGANPALFEQYLQRQQDVLAELVKKFGEAPMLREAGPAIQGARTSTKSTESGRVRSR